LDIHPLSTKYRAEGGCASNSGHLQQTPEVEQDECVPGVIPCRLGVTGRRSTSRRALIWEGLKIIK